MNNYKEMVVFIPIKKNSQRVPNKNFRYIKGFPLYQHTLQKLKDYKVFVDTDSDEIIEEIKSNKFAWLENINVFKRKEDLVGDDVSVCDLIENFIIDNYHSQDLKNKYICQMHVTNPFLDIASIKNAHYVLFNKVINVNIEQYDSVVSCNRLQTRFWREESYGYVPINHNPIKLEQTQDLPVYYEENSCFYIFETDNFLSTKTRIGKRPFFYEIKFPHNIDIDTEKDWDLVKILSREDYVL